MLLYMQTRSRNDSSNNNKIIDKGTKRKNTYRSLNVALLVYVK